MLHSLCGHQPNQTVCLASVVMQQGLSISVAHYLMSHSDRVTAYAIRTGLLREREPCKMFDTLETAELE